MSGSLLDKAVWRKICAEKRAAICADVRRNAEEKICESVSLFGRYREASLLLFYAPIGSEANVRPLIEEALEQGRRAAFPRCEAEPGVMTFRTVRSIGELNPGAYGVLEPARDAPLVTTEELARADAFALVPGLAFDREGYRLGYGKGYYDRFLPSFGGFAAGVCFEEQIFDRLPANRFDIRVNALISERGVTVVHA